MIGYKKVVFCFSLDLITHKNAISALQILCITCCQWFTPMLPLLFNFCFPRQMPLYSPDAVLLACHFACCFPSHANYHFLSTVYYADAVRGRWYVPPSFSLTRSALGPLLPPGCFLLIAGCFLYTSSYWLPITVLL